MQYEIRVATETEIRLMLDWAAIEGWNPGIYDHISFQAADPNGFFIGYMGDTPAASLAAIKYSGDYGFIGLYIVQPEFRGKGLGIKIWNHGLEYLKNTSIVGLDGVIEQQQNYKKSGFNLAHRNIRFSGVAQAVKTVDSLIDIKDISVEVILELDQQLFPCNRQNFLKPWLAYAEKGLAYFDKDVLRGYGVLRRCNRGYKIGPLFAENHHIAEQLFLGLCNHVSGKQISLDTPEPNLEAIKIAERYHLKPIFETARMYTNSNPCLNLRNIFGITTFELG